MDIKDMFDENNIPDSFRAKLESYLINEKSTTENLQTICEYLNNPFKEYKLNNFQ